MWRQALPDAVTYFTEYTHKHYKVIIHKAIYDSRRHESCHSLSVCIKVFSTGHMLRIIILINKRQVSNLVYGLLYTKEEGVLEGSEVP